MKIMNKIGEAFRLYFILVTLITILLMVLGFLLDRDRTFGYEVFLSPLIYAAIGVIPTFFFDNEKEVSLKGLIIRRIIQLFVIEAAIMILITNSKRIDTGNVLVIVGIAVGIVVVFIIALIVEYLFELSISRGLNEALEKYQKE